MALVELGSILHFEKGKKPISQSDSPADGFLPYVDIEVFETGKIKQYTDGTRCTPCDDGDILIVCDGSRSGLVGRAVKGYVGSTLAKISADCLSDQYLFHFVQGKYVLLNTKKKGTGTPHLNQELLKQQKLIVPSYSEQERIVARIEELFSQLDAGVETLKKTKAQLSVYRQAVLKEAFEGDYPRKQLKEFSKAISGFAFKSSRYSPDGNYVVVKIGNVKERHFDFSRDLTKTLEADDSILEKYLLRRGDCLITLTGSRGKRDYGFVAMVGNQNNYLLNQRVAALRFDQSVALPEFFQYYLASPSYRDMFFGYETGNVGQGNVGIKALLDPCVILPDIDTQKRIVEDVEDRLSVCDSIEQTVDTALQQAEVMRQSILKQAFKGEL